MQSKWIHQHDAIILSSSNPGISLAGEDRFFYISFELRAERGTRLY
jgi:hypothetical protein